MIGPSADGGYYLIGMKLAHPAPFQNISWSTNTVAAETRTRCFHAGIELVELPLWYDVDDAATLELLSAELLQGTSPEFVLIPGYLAENTRTYLKQLDRTFVSRISGEEAVK